MYEIMSNMSHMSWSFSEGWWYVLVVATFCDNIVGGGGGRGSLKT